MLGCTSPPFGRSRLARWRAECPLGLRAWRLGFFLCLALLYPRTSQAQSAVAGKLPVRLRVEWGGGARMLWQGSVRLVDPAANAPVTESSADANADTGRASAKLERLQLLGIEADEVGTMWLDGQAVIVRSRSTRAYDGFDVTAMASPSAKLVIELGPRPDGEQLAPPQPIEIPLADVLYEFDSHPLDQSGNRLLVRRVPGDQLRMQAGRAALLYKPGEPLDFKLRPHLLDIPAETPLRVDVTMRAVSGGRTVASDSQELPPAADGTWPEHPITFACPNEEGVYELAILASAADFRSRIGLRSTLAERTVQFVVFKQEPPEANTPGAVQWTLEAEIDPANTSWWKRFTSIPIPGLTRRPLASGDSEIREHPLGRVRQLSSRRADREPSWEALPVAVSRPGQPYMLEVEYPQDAPQTLGISVIEPDASGAVMPIGLDSGVAVTTGSNANVQEWKRHQLVFWPRTKTPLVLLTNLHPERPAAFGKIRVLRGPINLPPAFKRDESAGRSFWAYLHKPLFAENFSAPDSLDPWSGRSLDNWQTMYLGGTRLVEYLRNTGHTGLMMTVMTDGSTIYPSQVVEPTPRYDTGLFFSTAPDPVRKDTLELLLRLFDREEMEFVPALNFAGPIETLEHMIRGNSPERHSLEWVNSQGRPWRMANRESGSVGALYNVLDPRVQETIRQAVAEVLQKCKAHPSWRGLALHLSPDGFLLLPESTWGMDDNTMARFTADTGIALPQSGPDRFAGRAEILTRMHRQAWLQWRASKFSEFLISLASDVTAARPGAKLYLSTASLLETPSVLEQLRPTLPSRQPLEELLLERGLDSEKLKKTPGLVMLEPHVTAPLHSLKLQGGLLDLQTTDSLARFGGEGATLAPMFFHPPQKVRLESFDVQSPYPNSFAWLVAQASFEGAMQRRRFVRRLAQADTRLMIDGGWLLPLGQESAMKNLLHSFRQLPAGRFQQLSAVPQPLTIRTRAEDGKLYVYLINNAPWATEASIGVRAPAGCRVEGLVPAASVPPLTSDSQGLRWRLTLEPYSLVAARFSQESVELFDPQINMPEATLLALENQVNDLAARTATLRDPPALSTLANPDFEQSGDSEQIAAFWALSTGGNVAGQRVATGGHHGQAYFEFSSDGPTASLVSSPLDVPASGRLSVAVWLRLPEGAPQPPLRLALDGRVRGQDFYRHVLVGQGRDVPRIGTTWGQYVFQVPDLPLEDFATVRVRFDMMGPGKVQIDHVQLFDLAFRQKELIELSKLITLANVKLQHREVSDCLAILEGYWPRFLTRHVPPVAQAVAAKQSPIEETPAEPESPTQPAEDEPAKPGFFGRLKGYIPRFMRF